MQSLYRLKIFSEITNGFTQVSKSIMGTAHADPVNLINNAILVNYIVTFGILRFVGRL